MRCALPCSQRRERGSETCKVEGIHGERSFRRLRNKPPSLATIGRSIRQRFDSNGVNALYVSDGSPLQPLPLATGSRTDRRQAPAHELRLDDRASVVAWIRSRDRSWGTTWARGYAVRFAGDSAAVDSGRRTRRRGSRWPGRAASGGRAAGRGRARRSRRRPGRTAASCSRWAGASPASTWSKSRSQGIERGGGRAVAVGEPAARG